MSQTRSGQSGSSVLRKVGQRKQILTFVGHVRHLAVGLPDRGTVPESQPDGVILGLVMSRWGRQQRLEEIGAASQD
jgi:hypothetical protein